MKSILKLLIFNMICCISINSQDFDNVINLFIKPYPYSNEPFMEQPEADQLCKLINCNLLNLPLNFGIFATYMGYITYSNEIGQIIFPRKTVKDSINLLIANDIEPIFMLKNTIAFWKIHNKALAQMYKFERKIDLETKLNYWEVTKRDIPKNNKIPLHTIIIFANTEDIFVPTGITPTNAGPQLILPNIYVKLNTNYVKNALFTLTIKPFYSPLKKIYKERPTGYDLQITEA
jgi:hypothetical protein